MGTTYRITDGTSSVDISPIRGQNDPENRGREVMINKAGVTDAYDWGGKNVYEVPFNALSKAKADQLVTWWDSLTVLTFTPDLQGAPGTTKQVVIDEVPRPVQMWGGNWDTLFAGLVTLYEASSISFSSSSQSVSRSRSCSSISASHSRLPDSSLSCSLFLTSVSDSVSVGNKSTSESCSTGDSSSCSTSLSVSASTSVTSDSCSQSSLLELSCSGSVSRSSGIVAVSFTSQSCSNDSSGGDSFSVSDGDESCSVSGVA